MSSKKSYWFFESILSLGQCLLLLFTSLSYQRKELMIFLGGVALIVSIFIVCRTIFGVIHKKYYVSFIGLGISILICNRCFVDGICYKPTEYSQFFQVILPLIVSGGIAIFVSSAIVFAKLKQENHCYKTKINCQ